MLNTKHEQIRDLQLFKDISDGSFQSLTRAAYVQNFPPQTQLITEGDPPDFLHIVESGLVELFGNWAGRETTISTVRPVATFILAASINDRPYLMSARTLDKSRIIMIPSEDVRAVFKQDPDFARAIVTELAGCYRTSIKNTKNLKLRTSRERLANYLLKLHQRTGSDEFDLLYEKRILASYLGMTPENLSRSFKALSDFGVNVEGLRVTLSDKEALAGYANPDELIDG